MIVLVAGTIYVLFFRTTIHGGPGEAALPPGRSAYRFKFDAGELILLLEPGWEVQAQPPPEVILTRASTLGAVELKISALEVEGSDAREQAAQALGQLKGDEGETDRRRISRRFRWLGDRRYGTEELVWDESPPDGPAGSHHQLFVQAGDTVLWIRFTVASGESPLLIDRIQSAIGSLQFTSSDEGDDR
jgi:hypothetical protein